MNKFESLNIAKWTLVEISEVSTEINEKLTSLAEYENEKFIRPEDLEIGDFYIKSHRTTEGVQSGKKCYYNDIIFARRSVSVSQFKRRSCILNFDAICSDELTVIRENNKVIAGFLNLVLNTTNLWDYAISRSVGSVSKRIKWQDLSKYQFKLPPKDEQEKILSLFLTLEKQIEETEAQEGNLLKTKRQILRELFSGKKKFGSYLKPENFEKVTFGKLAEHISKRVEPAQTDLEIYTGLEHLDPDNLKIERVGTPADVKGTKLLIWKGDIIFGKRRAYQRKVAVSHFDGICSAHSMVLRAKEKNINKVFLPYFMQSDEFMERAVQISEGSLSPTIKWKVLEKQEFEVPKLEYQPILVEIFESFDKLISELRIQKETLKKLKHKLLDEILG